MADIFTQGVTKGTTQRRLGQRARRKLPYTTRLKVIDTESANNLRKLVSCTTDWAAQVEEYEESTEQVKQEFNRYRRRLQLSECEELEKQEVKREKETDKVLIAKREKHISYGKNTVGYENYVKLVPFGMRTRDHPKTPNKYRKCSRRSWDTQIKIWRRALHFYDGLTGKRSQCSSRASSVFGDCSSEGSLETTQKSFIGTSMESGVDMTTPRNTPCDFNVEETADQMSKTFKSLLKEVRDRTNTKENPFSGLVQITKRTQMIDGLCCIW
ncbi:unnamed protein product [Owenia fusiformis]|uniref:Histone RNA hairpin-binding protein RNA-binding domain-containing protein n=1 Tax=Owenia fusiformis TaxID=6347 RepID=A0A8S4NTT7_OWEFU|nr:unnamed protein product [Owenia fusiformis]